MISTDKITEIFYVIDEFCKEFEKVTQKHRLVEDTGIKTRKRTSKLSDSEVMTIMVLFHYKQFRNLKHFYLYYVQVHMKKDFPQTVSYNRFIELQQQSVLPLALFLKTCCLGDCTGISFIDSTPLRVCHNKREKQHKVFKGTAAKGQCSLGWFFVPKAFGIKLHLIINDKGEILDFMLTQGNVDDRDPLKNHNFHKRIFGKIYGDKGYIGKDLFEQLFIDGVHLVTKIRKNMKNCLMLLQDRIMLRKRALIETVNDELKNQCQVEHTRHRSFENFITNLLSGLVAYSFFDKKPALNLEVIDKRLVA
ncbi:Transposase DDE domain-containing protein [Sinomicrobium oceani]|uniref:Transposase DDE domain-containing protein n=1 Tax=Sinomicrobium oceani TaxID=1150368 RepID=A0A1K1M1R4_9FLAO|nr:IS982 family transposase [Sinomicrobium oceani]SFW17083.1 Transposase DDE domain-containing protein [Sinomicrobium oceani]